ncbi:hypothetical protein UA08_07658 [Talaromyces atroroseus]|uniref:Major facilitator superfamily (MFS) profile domain-containing protein n=1 Tax=Talaromyces atroroseus TaxID=1441469 RepID=A0A225ASL3_TALAT|nr:hypothetical protein UA08_07658 [Talaromyces atroroseus]OKL57415.1 hypothetical protein UA08_07658 [Talaromyces atroroseus]
MTSQNGRLHGHAENGDSDFDKEKINGPQISAEHREYLIRRHGAADLDPMPAMDKADPHNWPYWKKMANLFLVAFHALMGPFTAAAIIPSYSEIAKNLGIAMQTATYLTTLQIAVLAGSPLVWRPLIDRFGRRPIFLLSLLCSGVGNIGCAVSPSYGSMAACRAIVAFFISPATSLGSVVVAESFFKHERARYMGIWTLLVTVGGFLSPLLFGFVTQRIGYRWVYWILAITNAVQFLLYLVFGPETRYMGPEVNNRSAFRRQYLTFFRRIDPTPLTWYEFIEPLTLVTRSTVTVPGVAYTMVFLWGSILVTVEVPALLQEKYHLSVQALGLQFISTILGSFLGEVIGGAGSDYWMNSRRRRKQRNTPAEYRLWLSYFGFLFAIVGTIVFLTEIQFTPAGRWSIKPMVGATIACMGNQIVTTVLMTYAVDNNMENAASVPVHVQVSRTRQKRSHCGMPNDSNVTVPR